MNLDETRLRFGDIAAKFLDALALNNINAKILGAEQSGLFTNVIAQMAFRDITQLQDNRIAILKVLGCESLRVGKFENGIVEVEIALPFECQRYLPYHDVMLDVVDQIKDMAVPIMFGKKSNGENVVQDLAQMPHLLIGGDVGTGKSIFLGTLISTIIQHRSPEQVQLVLMDLKRVEFWHYVKLPHLFAPIVNNQEAAVAVLKHIEAEMDRRLNVFDKKGCRTIADFNELNDGKKLSRLTVFANEISDFIVGTGGEFETTVSRIAAIGRPAGIHLVLTTERPCAHLPGSIKANIPVRLAFKVRQRADSLKILDEEGAYELVGRGDALLKEGTGLIARLQIPYIHDEAIERIVDSAIVRYPVRKKAVV